jgi:hypothetical protein
MLHGGYTTQPGVSTPGTIHPATRPHKALLRCAFEKNTRRARVGGAEGTPENAVHSPDFAPQNETVFVRRSRVKKRKQMTLTVDVV